MFGKYLRVLSISENCFRMATTPLFLRRTVRDAFLQSTDLRLTSTHFDINVSEMKIFPGQEYAHLSMPPKYQESKRVRNETRSLTKTHFPPNRRILFTLLFFTDEKLVSQRKTSSHLSSRPTAAHPRKSRHRENTFSRIKSSRLSPTGHCASR